MRQSLRGAANQLSTRWAALLDAGAAVGVLAGLAAEKTSPKARNFPALVRDAADWRQDLAERHIEDLAAIMQPGLTALLAVGARGQDAAAPAMTLWREFHAARESILGLVPDSGHHGPLRSA